MQTEMRFHWDRLESYMTEAVTKARDENHKHISDAIIGSIPSMIEVLRDVIKSSDASPTQRMRACEILFSSWSRCLRADLREQRASVSRAKSIAKQAVAAAEKTKASAASKQASLTIARERKKIARQLARQLAEQAQPVPQPKENNIQ